MIPPKPPRASRSFVAEAAPKERLEHVGLARWSCLNNSAWPSLSDSPRRGCRSGFADRQPRRPGDSKGNHSLWLEPGGSAPWFQPVQHL